MQDSLTKQWETSPSVALPLDKLELVHKTLGHPIGVALAQASKDGLLVAFESCCKSLQFEEPAFGNLLFPSEKTRGLPLPHHLPKVLNQCIESREFGTELTQGIQVNELLLLK